MYFQQLQLAIISQRDNATFLGGGGYKLQQFSEIYVVPAITTRWQIWIRQPKKNLLMGLGGKLIFHYQLSFLLVALNKGF